MKISIEYKIVIAFISSFLLVLLFSIISYYDMNKLKLANKNNREAQFAIESLKELKSNLVAVESSGTEYALIGKKEFLTSYNNAVENTRTQWRNLKALLIADTHLNTQTETIDQLIPQHAVFTDNVVNARTKDEAAELITSGRGAKLNGQLLSEFEKAEDHLRLLLKRSDQEELKFARRTALLFFLLAAATLTILSLAYYMIKKNLGGHKKAKLELKELNASLENSVRIRTDALINSERMYRLLATNCLDVISLATEDGTYTYVSESCKRIFGYEPSMLIGRSGYDFVHPDDKVNVHSVHLSLLSASPHTEPVQFRYLKKDGQYLWVESAPNIILDANGNFENIIVSTRDISSRKKGEEILAKNQQMLNSILENTNNPVFIKDLEGKYILANKQFEIDTTLIYGVEPGTLLGKSDNDFVPADAAEEMRKDDLEAINTGEIIKTERSFIINGMTHSYIVVKFPLYDNNLKIYALCGIATDITSFKNAEKQILDSRAKLSAMLQNSIDPIFSIDKNFKLVEYNLSFETNVYLLYNIRLYKGMNALDIYKNELEMNWKNNFERAFEGEYFTDEMKLTNKVDEFCFDVSFNPITVGSKIEEIAIFQRDITVRKKIEKQLNYKINELNTFMYKASHDLRSPLVSVMGLVGLAKDEAKTNPALIQYFEMIDKSVAKMDKLLIDLVSITNVSQGKLNISEIKFDVMVSDIIESLSHYPNFENMIIRKKIQQREGFFNDEKLLYSVLQNLIDNALKYRHENYKKESMIIITVDYKDDDEVRINITDNGIGIPLQAQEKVFDMFYRAASISSGTGLGLYIVKTAVEKMGGEILLSSEEGAGTSINITLPSLVIPELEKITG